MSQLSQEVRQVLEVSEIDSEAFTLQIGQELERSLYTSLDAVLKLLGGKWNKSKGLHQFLYDPAAAIDTVLKTGNLPPKNANAFFPTPLPIIQRLFEHVDDYIEYESEFNPIKILEPSAGVGAIAEFIREKAAANAVIDTVEIMETNQAVLQKKGFTPFCGSFLDFNKPEEYAFIIANPPFSLKGDSKAFITHIEHAFKMLAKHGQLVAILPTGWITGSTKRDIDFRDMVAKYGRFQIEIVEGGAFKESGTNVETCIVSLHKTDFYSESHDGYKSYGEWQFHLNLTNDEHFRKRYEDITSAIEFDAESAKQLCNEFIAAQAKAHTFHAPSMLDDFISLIKSDWEDQRPYMESKEVEIVELVKALDIEPVKPIEYDKNGQGLLIAC